MARTVSLLLSAQHSADLQGVMSRGQRASGEVKHVQRGRKSSCCPPERLPVLEIAKRVGISRPMVWRWQQRFAEERHLRVCCATKPVRLAFRPVPQAKVHAKRGRAHLARGNHPVQSPIGPAAPWQQGDAGVFRCRERSSAYGLPISSSLHRIQDGFKRSQRSRLRRQKLDDVVGLYMNPPPRHAVVGLHRREKKPDPRRLTGPSRVFR